MEVEKELMHMAFLQREGHSDHLSFEGEIQIYERVRDGEIERVREDSQSFATSDKGQLSKDEVRNLRYHFVIGTAMTTRFCVEGGMEHMEAYHLSDYFIQRMDECRTSREIASLYTETLLAFATRMKELHEKKCYSKPVILCMDYIYDHLHERIYVKDIAAYVKMNVSYAEELFKKETGLSIAEYIRNKRITAAQNMLRYSEFSTVDISNYLAFHSHSHFISVFKKYTGKTPREYRLENYRNLL